MKKRAGGVEQVPAYRCGSQSEWLHSYAVPICFCMPRTRPASPHFNAGEELHRVVLPVKRPTACTFGGDQLQHLYVTTRVETGGRVQRGCFACVVPACWKILELLLAGAGSSAAM